MYPVCAMRAKIIAHCFMLLWWSCWHLTLQYCTRSQFLHSINLMSWASAWMPQDLLAGSRRMHNTCRIPLPLNLRFKNINIDIEYWHIDGITAALWRHSASLHHGEICTKCRSVHIVPQSTLAACIADQKCQASKKVQKGAKMSKRTTPGIPTWSPTVVLTWPDSA